MKEETYSNHTRKKRSGKKKVVAFPLQLRN
jgi:hypothetical protein